MVVGMGKKVQTQDTFPKWRNRANGINKNCTEISYKELKGLVHMIIEAEKSKICGWLTGDPRKLITESKHLRTRIANGVSSSLKPTNSRGKRSPCFRFTPEAGKDLLASVQAVRQELPPTLRNKSILFFSGLQ